MPERTTRPLSSPTTQPNSSTPIVVVAGMHRSGTSLCARLLSAIGIDIADDIGKGVGNEEGHWERWELVQLHNRILSILHRENGEVNEYQPFHDLPLPAAWWANPEVRAVRGEIEAFLAERMHEDETFGFKDPRVSRLLPLWTQIFKRKNLTPKYVLCVRNPDEVASSLWSRDKIPPEAGLYRWLLYNSEFIAGATEGFFIVSYDEWFRTPEDTLRRLASFVGVEDKTGALTPRDVLAVVDVGQRHNSRPPRADGGIFDRMCGLLASGAGEIEDRRELVALARQIVEFSRLTPFEPALLNSEKVVAELKQQVEALSLLVEGAGTVKSGVAPLREQEVKLRETIAVQSSAIDSLLGRLSNADKQLTERRTPDAGGARMMRELRAANARAIASEMEASKLRLALERTRIEPEGNPPGQRRDSEQESSGADSAVALERVSWSWMRALRDYILLRRSGLFHPQWYWQTYADVPASRRWRLPHFVTRGWIAGHNPNRLFDTQWYLARYPDVRVARINPVVHYLTTGALEGRDPGPGFQTSAYVAAHPELRRSQVNPLAHHLKRESLRKRRRE